MHIDDRLAGAPDRSRVGAVEGLSVDLGREPIRGVDQVYKDGIVRARHGARLPEEADLQAGCSRAPEQHARLIDAFGRLDSEMIGWARTQVLSTVRSSRPRSVNHRAMAPLVKYAHAKRRPALRTMLGNSREAVQLLKPTLLMSPLAAAQYLCHGDGATYRFDTVIVDEASMIPTPDMVVALSLAEQAIIVGDSRQMPPTNFFNKEISPLADDQSQEVDVTFASILDEAAPLLS